MKQKLLPSLHSQLTARGLILGFGLLVCGSASAQINLLQNGNFDTEPLGPTNWTVLYLHGGPENWEIKDRATPCAPHQQSFYDGTFRPISQKLAHACFAQTVNNLTPGHLYNVSGQMREDWWRYASSNTNFPYDPDGDGFRNKFLVYIEAIGSLGTPTPDGRASVLATNPTPVYTNADCAIYAIVDWTTYSTKQKPDTNGRIEIRLHYNMVGYVEWDKLWLMGGYFDSISLTY
jgi:hypothetical protein